MANTLAWVDAHNAYVSNGDDFVAHYALDANYQLVAIVLAVGVSRDEEKSLLRAALQHVSNYGITRKTPSFSDAVEAGEQSSSTPCPETSKAFLSLTRVDYNIHLLRLDRLQYYLENNGVKIYRLRYRTIGEAVIAWRKALGFYVKVTIQSVEQALYSPYIVLQVELEENSNLKFTTYEAIDVGRYDSARVIGHPENAVDKSASHYVIEGESGQVLGAHTAATLHHRDSEGVLCEWSKLRETPNMRYVTRRIVIKVNRLGLCTSAGVQELVTLVNDLAGVRGRFVAAVSVQTLAA